MIFETSRSAPSPGILIGVLLAVLATGPAAALDLAEKLASGEAVVATWSHSGVGVKTARHFLVFDYIRQTARSGGERRDFLDPGELPAGRVVVFVTHAHKDHHDPVIYSWAEVLPDLHYVVSEDVARTSSFRKAELPASRVSILAAGEKRTLLDGALDVRTVRSTDQGVAFRVGVDGLDLVHTGDHALWGWQPERMEAVREIYLGALDRLVPPGDAVDIAFLCADLRVPAESGLSGAAEAVRRLKPGLAVAIHNYSRHREAATALRAALPEEDRHRVAGVRGPGTLLRYPPRPSAVGGR